MFDFEKAYDNMSRHKMRLPEEKIHIRVDNARQVLESAMRAFLRFEGRQLHWLPEYGQVADWLGDNCGRGLFLYGRCGRGKSLLCRYVLPAIILQYCNKVVHVYDMQEVNKDIDQVLSKPLISLDDVGTEEQSVKYGERRTAFCEVMDAAEKQNKLLFVTTNLNADEIRRRYGDRTLDRIKSTTRRILCTGESLRS